MTFEELQAMVEEMLSLGGNRDTAYKPSPGTLINRAYKEFVWETECKWGIDSSLTTVVDQREYTLAVPEWKRVQSVHYGEVPLTKMPAMSVENMLGANWYWADASDPMYWWRAESQTIWLHPKPATASVALNCFGLRAPAALVALGSPLIPEVYHWVLAERAYALHAKTFARGDELTALMQAEGRYLDKLSEWKRQFAQQRMSGATRNRQDAPVEIDW